MVLSSVVALTFPARCPGCGVPAEPMCGTCLATVRPAPQLAVPPGLDALFVPFAYEGVIRELVARAKYRNRHAALTWIAHEMAMAITVAEVAPVDVVTWAPTTARRRRERGFDQAELLATAIASELRRPVRVRLRRGAGAAQTGATRAARAEAPILVPTRTRGPRPRSEAVLLVDDVITTGATLRAAARALRSGGSARVIGVTAARRA